MSSAHTQPDADTLDETTELPCATKLAFPTREKAQAVAAVEAYRHGTKLIAYRCQHCEFWHLSSRSSNS